MPSYVALHILQGFRQHTDGEFWNGCHELRELLNREFDSYSRCTLEIRVIEWNADFKSVAQHLNLRMERFKIPRENLGIGLFPFSWGVGHGTPAYADVLGDFGYNIHTCVPSDGIFWRDDYLLGFLGNWTAFLGDSRIKFPDNILHTIPFQQKRNRPHGRGIATTQTMEPMTTLPYIHTKMDDAPEWHLKCLEVAREIVREYMPAVATPPQAPTVAKVIKDLQESKLVHESDVEIGHEQAGNP